MIKGKKILALIPARGGSKGIKNKNIIDVEGKPLIAYTIETAIKSKYVDKAIVTTDSKKIKNISEKFGADVPFIRPREYATDHSTTLSVVLHAIEKLGQLDQRFDILVLLQPTSPLRTTNDLDGAIEKFVENEYRPLAAISLVSDSPILIRRLIDDSHMERILPVQSSVRRQDMPMYYRINGSIYINNIKEINKYTSFNDNELPYVIEAEHAIDVDDIQDLELVRYYLRNK